MATIGKKKKTIQPKIALPRYYKQVSKSVRGEKGGYNITNSENLEKFFTKKGDLKKSALRSNKQRKEFNEELKKAKEEIKQLQAENKRLKEELKQYRKEQKKKRKDEQKRKKQIKSYKENGNTATHDASTYEDFIDILDEVYDEVALLFYDSDQIMQMIESPDVSRDDIVNLLKDINKKKMESLTNEEKLLLKTGKYHLNNMENEQLVKDVSNALYLSSRSDLTPQAWYNMSISSPMEYMRAIGDILTEDEIRKYITG